MSGHLHGEKLRAMRDCYMELLGFELCKPMWIGLRHEGREIVARQPTPMRSITDAEVTWESITINLPPPPTPPKWWQFWRRRPAPALHLPRDLSLEVIEAPTQEHPGYVVDRVFTTLSGSGGSVVVSDIKVKVSG